MPEISHLGFDPHFTTLPAWSIKTNAFFFSLYTSDNIPWSRNGTASLAVLTCCWLGIQCVDQTDPKLRDPLASTF